MKEANLSSPQSTGVKSGEVLTNLTITDQHVPPHKRYQTAHLSTLNIYIYIFFFLRRHCKSTKFVWSKLHPKGQMMIIRSTIKIPHGPTDLWPSQHFQAHKNNQS